MWFVKETLRAIVWRSYFAKLGISATGNARNLAVSGPMAFCDGPFKTAGPFKGILRALKKDRLWVYSVEKLRLKRGACSDST
jgi:hypothetical protein